MISVALSRISGAANKALLAVAVCCTGVMVAPTVLDVLARAVSSHSVPGATELAECLMLGLVFGSFGYLQHHRAHLRVELIVHRLPPVWQEALDWAGNAAALVFFGFMARCVWNLAWVKIRAGETTMMLGLPVGWLHLFAVLGLAGLCLALLAQVIEPLTKPREHARALGLGMLGAALLLALPFLARPFFAGGQHLLALGAGGMAFLMVLLLLGLPIGMVMAGVGYMGLVALYPSAASANLMLGMSPPLTASSYVYTVIPMFILMGELALCAGISADLFRTASLWLGRLPGGLAVATVAGCAGFSAVSGDSMATAVTMAAVALPEMEKHGYDPGLACATLAAGGTLGILIPPSTGFIFYSLVTEESVGKLFVAGIIPGLVLTLLFILILMAFAKRHPELAPRGASAPLGVRLRSLSGVLPMISLITLIIGGILAGWFSPNEAGAVGAAGTALFALCRGRLTWRDLRGALASTTVVTARLMLILTGVGLLSAFFAASALPMRLAQTLADLNTPPGLFIAAVIVFYALLGCIMNVVPMILLTLPALYPSVMAMGFDSVWFGVLVVVLMEMGQVTPPVGLNVYAMAATARHVPMADIFRRVTPFVLAMLTLAVLLVFFPALATWLPHLLFR